MASQVFTLTISLLLTLLVGFENERTWRLKLLSFVANLVPILKRAVAAAHSDQKQSITILLAISSLLPPSRTTTHALCSGASKPRMLFLSAAFLLINLF